MAELEHQPTLEKDKYKEAKEKFFEGYEKFKRENPNIVLDAQKLAKEDPHIPKIEGVTEETIIMFAYGMDLARQEYIVAEEIDLPPVHFDRRYKLGAHIGKHDTEDIKVFVGYEHFNQAEKDLQKGNRLGNALGKLIRRFSNENTIYLKNISDDTLAEIIRSGAHEYAHEVVDQIASPKRIGEIREERITHTFFDVLPRVDQRA